MATWFDRSRQSLVISLLASLGGLAAQGNSSHLPISKITYPVRTGVVFDAYFAGRTERDRRCEALREHDNEL